jgi:ubiquinone/menaquinone biosynthesis C-methylase UbiE
MLTRTLEPEVMDTPEEARAYDTMDHREVNARFVEDFLADAQGFGIALAGDVLDLGTGTAQIPIALCRRNQEIRVIAVDAAAAMLQVGAENVAAAGLGERIVLERADAKRLPYAAGRFGAVMSNSIVHHIPQPGAVLAEAVRVTAPGGFLFFRDLMRPPDVATLDRLVETYAAGGDDVQRALFADSLRAALTITEARALISSLGFDPQGLRPTSDRHWTWSARVPDGPIDSKRVADSP